MRVAYKIVFAGTPEFGAIQLSALLKTQHKIIAVLTQPDRPTGRGQKIIASPVKTLALQNNLSVYQPATLKDPSIQEILRNLDMDFFIDAAYGLIIPRAILDMPRLGCINVHGSLLPRWRGAAPIQRAILAGDKETGITIMGIEEGLDTGPILLQASCPIHDTDTLGSLENRLAALGAATLIQVIDKLAQDKLTPIKQNEAQTSYAKKIEKHEAKIDWSKSAVEIDRQVRAFNPRPVAYTQINQKMIRVWQTKPLNKISEKEPGVIEQINKESLDVATGHGILRLLTIQFSGKKALGLNEILKSKKTFFEEHHQFI